MAMQATNSVQDATQYIAWISLDNQQLACSELELLLGARIVSRNENKTEHASAANHVIRFELADPLSAGMFPRLAYTKVIAKIIESFSLDAAPEKLMHKLPDGSYKVEFFNSLLDISQEIMNKIFAAIFHSIDHPQVNLTNPQRRYWAYIQNQTAWISEEVWSNDFAYEKRKPHLLEAKHSAAMHPKLMRVMVNLAGICSGTINDPFCGMAGILIEAIHCGLHAIGSDLDSRMVAGAKKNIANEIVAAPQLSSLCNPQEIARISATNMKTTADAIVTDVPYGKNTKKLRNPQLYFDFLVHVAEHKLSNRIVICFPHYAKAQEIIEKTQWTIVRKFSLPVHNSLTRELFILDLKKSVASSIS